MENREKLRAREFSSQISTKGFGVKVYTPNQRVLAGKPYVVLGNPQQYLCAAFCLYLESQAKPNIA